ncbi:helix-turn-helix transcriptional regulator [Devosia sp.]|uniref:helix-turn-helix transcriptional regulator n=1 Tax=Devosia sp. TaxID=1871048 RepID=UPI003F723109
MSTERGLTIPEFCQKHGFSRAQFYVLKKRGLGPIEYRIGVKLVRISPDAEAAWLRTWQQAAETERTSEAA